MNDEGNICVSTALVGIVLGSIIQWGGRLVFCLFLREMRILQHHALDYGKLTAHCI